MVDKIKWVRNDYCNKDDRDYKNVITYEEARKALNFHRTIPGYKATPLVNLKGLAGYFNVRRIYVKDESYRFGLNAFKALGASYAMARYVSGLLHKDITDTSFEELSGEETHKKLKKITFYSATDGNHGRAVAWMARKLGQKSVIYMPKGSTDARLKNILEAGAEACITDMNYDDAVRFAAGQARLNGGVVIQDTAWEGYEDIPSWIMQGYSTLALEALNQMDEKPTHIFLQAGVGSFAGAMQGFFSDVYKDNPPIAVIVESDKADCYFRSAIANDGTIHAVTGDMLTLMAGLACGEPNTISYELLKSKSRFFASCPDWVSAYGMRVLGNPIDGDVRVKSGESGAVGLGLFAAVMGNEDMNEFKKALGINENSSLLFVSTEGDTDPECYRDVVWRGRNQY